MGFFVGGDLDMPKGGSTTSSIGPSSSGRCSTTGRCTTGAVDFRDRDGSPLDLHRAFSVDDDPADLAHFLAEAGFLHLTGVFDARDASGLGRDGRGDAALRAGRRSFVVGEDGGRHEPARAPPVLPRAVADHDRTPRRRSIAHARGPDERRSSSRQARIEQQHRRGAGEADRHRRRDLRRAVAQGLQPRESLLPVLLDDRRHLGHGRRRRFGSAPRRGRFAPGADPARVRAGGVSISHRWTCRRGPATSPST